MINLNSFKWGLGLVAFFALGLSGCYMDSERAHLDYYYPHHKDRAPAQSTNMQKNSAETATAHKASSGGSKEPVQQEAPGPKRSAAPQIPVIQ